MSLTAVEIIEIIKLHSQEHSHYCMLATLISSVYAEANWLRLPLYKTEYKIYYRMCNSDDHLLFHEFTNFLWSNFRKR